MKAVGDLITITKWTENKDGGSTMQYILTDTGTEVFQKLAKKQKKPFTKAFVNKTIFNALKEATQTGFSLGS